MAPTDPARADNLKVFEAPAIAVGTAYQSAAHALGLAMTNATVACEQSLNMAQAAAVQGVIELFSAGPEETKSLRTAMESRAGGNPSVPTGSRR